MAIVEVAESPGARRVLRLKSPATLEPIGEIECAGAEDVRAAVERARKAQGAWAKLTERIYVVEDVYDAFLEKVVKRTQQLRQSDSGEGDVGAVFWDRQLDVIEAHVQDAVAKGARVVVGGKRNPELRGLYFQPTVVTEVSHEMDLMTRETFGPILAVMKVPDEDEAVRLANESDYGLNGNVWTGDSEKGFALAQRIETGGVCVNDMAITYGIPEAPFGGVKASGVGQVNGQSGIRGYCHAQPITADRKGKGKIQGGYPYSRKSEDGMQKFIRIFFGTRLARWLA